MISTLKSRAFPAINHTKTCVRKCLVCAALSFLRILYPRSLLKVTLSKWMASSLAVARVFLVSGLPLYCCYSDATRSSVPSGTHSNGDCQRLNDGNFRGQFKKQKSFKEYFEDNSYRKMLKLAGLFVVVVIWECLNNQHSTEQGISEEYWWCPEP